MLQGMRHVEATIDLIAGYPLQTGNAGPRQRGPDRQGFRTDARAEQIQLHPRCRSS
ncbi:hypothetical protein PSAB6_30374 [Paraburkholderia sabiae]|nr:hypothetical protein PSAB6_30374 [Paraburkholderia sabiae]